MKTEFRIMINLNDIPVWFSCVKDIDVLLNAPMPIVFIQPSSQGPKRLFHNVEHRQVVIDGDNITQEATLKARILTTVNEYDNAVAQIEDIGFKKTEN